MKKFSLFSMVNACALSLMVMAASVYCTWHFYQPEVPEGVEKFIK